MKFAMLVPNKNMGLDPQFAFGKGYYYSRPQVAELLDCENWDITDALNFMYSDGLYDIEGIFVLPYADFDTGAFIPMLDHLTQLAYVMRDGAELFIPDMNEIPKEYLRTFIRGAIGVHGVALHFVAEKITCQASSPLFTRPIPTIDLEYKQLYEQYLAVAEQECSRVAQINAMELYPEEMPF